jgi:hypothetical protein
MRQLVNFPTPCDAPSCAAIQVGDATEIVYGPEGAPGDQGPIGARGANGRNAFTATTSAFTMPVINALASVAVLDNQSFSIGQLVFLENVGYFSVESKTGTTQIALRNLGGTSAVPAGALIGSGLKLTSGAQPGWDTPGNTPKRYAAIAHREDMGDDGGPMDVQIGTGSSARGDGMIKNLEALFDPSSIVTIFGPNNSRFRIPNGSWKIRVRTPAYFSKGFKVYLIERPGPPAPPAPLVFYGTGTILALGNGFAGNDGEGAQPQRHAVAEALVSVTDPAKYFEVWMSQESWSFGRTNPTRDRAMGVASNFDDGAATPVREIYSIIEIEEP